MFMQICSPKDGLPSKRVVICCWVKKVHSYVGYEGIVEDSYHGACLLTYFLFHSYPIQDGNAKSAKEDTSVK
jgi:hypothetical protein